ncbi:MAG: response regulator transcription factor [Chloroflexi bacterium]|nr:response regulator transcription factor [Chloroflexota bacterium]
MSEPQVKLLLVDDHEVVRLGLKALFSTVPHFRVIGEAASAAEAVAEARCLQPDVVVMDVRLSGGSGVEACRDIRSERPETTVLMLTSYTDEEAVVASVMAGAAGYLLKHTRGERLVEAVETAARGESLLDSAVTRTVLDQLRRLGTQANGSPPALAALSDQERNVLPLIAEGKTNRQIAETLCLSENTIKTHVGNILQKLHLRRRSEAAALFASLRRNQHRMSDV